MYNQLIFIIVIIAMFIYFNNKINNDNENFANTLDSNMVAAVTNIYQADIESIRNLSSFATTLITPNSTLTNPGNLNVSGTIATGGAITTSGFITTNNNRIIANNSATNNWGMLWGDQCALIAKAGTQIRFGFATDTNASNWADKAGFDTNGNFRNSGNINAGGNIASNAYNLNNIGDRLAAIEEKVNGMLNGNVGFDKVNLNNVGPIYGVRTNGGNNGQDENMIQMPRIRFSNGGTIGSDNGGGVRLCDPGSNRCGVWNNGNFKSSL